MFGRVPKNAAAGQRLAFTCVRTAELPATWSALAASVGLPPPNKNRAVSWYWTIPSETSEHTIDAVIARAKQLGARLLFFLEARQRQLPSDVRFLPVSQLLARVCLGCLGCSSVAC